MSLIIRQSEIYLLVKIYKMLVAIKYFITWVSNIIQPKRNEKRFANLMRNVLGFEAEKFDQKKSPFLLHLALFAHHPFKSW